MNDDWRVWRPAIWLAMLGVAVALLVSPWYLSAVFFGAAIGSAIRIRQRRRRAVAAADSRQPQRRRRSGGKR
jgi:hypothetical protein